MILFICKTRAAAAWVPPILKGMASVCQTRTWPFVETRRHQCTNQVQHSSLPSTTATTSTQTSKVEIDETLAWRGDWKASDFATHVIAGTDLPTIAQAIASVLHRPIKNETTTDDSFLPMDPNAKLTANELLHIGAVWFMSAEASKLALKNTHNTPKPVRLSKDNSSQILNEGDYLRIHPNPRRFTDIYKYQWDKSFQPTNTTFSSSLNGVIIDSRPPHFLVIYKPANLPVHPTVDNAVENVAHSIQCTRDGAYTATPQRLDQNTSGLFVVATSKIFASYFSKLLSKKTLHHLMDNNTTNTTNDTTTPNTMTSTTMKKTYKCLVCITTNNHSTTIQQELQPNDLWCHYLEPSIRAPKRYARTCPDDTWAESWLRIIHVGPPCSVTLGAHAEALKRALWKEDTMPCNVVGVQQVSVELLTGRTHQIRGQFAAEGYPVVGDAQYGGAIPIMGYTDFQPSEQLALQCCEFEFLDPTMGLNGHGEEVAQPSNRWNRYRLENSWWTPFLETYLEGQ